MAASQEKVDYYARMEHPMPMDAQGTGAGQDAQGRFVMLGFRTRREIIEEIGYLSSDPETPILHACLNVLCQTLTGKAVMQAKLHQRQAIADCLSEDGTLSRSEEPYAALAEAVLHYAVHDYAQKRTGVTL